MAVSFENSRFLLSFASTSSTSPSPFLLFILRTISPYFAAFLRSLQSSDDSTNQPNIHSNKIHYQIWQQLWHCKLVKALRASPQFPVFLYVILFDSFAYNREINSTEFWVSNNQSNRSGVLSIFVYEKLSLAGDFLTRDSRGRKMMKNAKEWVRRLKIIVVQKIARNINYWRTLISFHLTTMELFAVFFFFCHWWSSFCRSTIMCRSQHEWVMTQIYAQNCISFSSAVITEFTWRFLKVLILHSHFGTFWSTNENINSIRCELNIKYNVKKCGCG